MNVLRAGPGGFKAESYRERSGGRKESSHVDHQGLRHSRGEPGQAIIDLRLSDFSRPTHICALLAEGLPRLSAAVSTQHLTIAYTAAQDGANERSHPGQRTPRRTERESGNLEAFAPRHQRKPIIQGMQGLPLRSTTRPDQRGAELHRICRPQGVYPQQPSSLSLHRIQVRDRVAGGRQFLGSDVASVRVLFRERTRPHQPPQRGGDLHRRHGPEGEPGILGEPAIDS